MFGRMAATEQTTRHHAPRDPYPNIQIHEHPSVRTNCHSAATHDWIGWPSSMVLHRASVGLGLVVVRCLVRVLGGVRAVLTATLLVLTSYTQITTEIKTQPFHSSSSLHVPLHHTFNYLTPSNVSCCNVIKQVTHINPRSRRYYYYYYYYSVWIRKTN